MSWNFKLGDKVVCINSDFKAGHGRWERPLVKERVYEIREVVNYNHIYAGRYLGLRLVGITRGIYEDVPFNSDRFRPVRTTSIECFRQHLVNIPKVKELMK